MAQQAWHIIKFVIAAGCGVVAIVALGFFRDYGLATSAGVVSLAFSQMPE
jgi:hypothetical protein